MSVPRLKQYQGPAILSYGFRPFFFLGAVYSGLAVLLWVPMFYGWLELQTAFSPVDWHIHEMLFGFLPAIVTGFLLTAIPNWTGRLPVQGKPLAVLVTIWLVGRIAILFSASIGAIPAAVVDCLFLASVAGVVANEIIVGRNWRNLKVLLPLSVLLMANIVFHAEAYLTGTTNFSRRIAVAAAIMLIILIGGRIIPSFTRNWLARKTPGRLPAPFDKFDASTVMVSVIAFGAWIVAPVSLIAGIAMLIAGILHLLRLARWAGDRTVREPLVFILHVAYFFVPIGFILSGLVGVLPDLVMPAAGFHAFGAGAIGTMTLAVMMRASLGHTGYALTMTTGSKLVFTLAVLAAAGRLVAVFDMSRFGWMIDASGAAWAAAFIGFGVVFGPKLLKRRALPA